MFLRAGHFLFQDLQLFLQLSHVGLECCFILESLVEGLMISSALICSPLLLSFGTGQPLAQRSVEVL